MGKGFLFEARQKSTALFFDADVNAVEGMNYLQDRGVMVPRDISIVGFDDTNYSSMVRPRITTIRQNIDLKGKLAIKQLNSLIEFGSVKERNIKNSVELVVRDSVKQLDILK